MITLLKGTENIIFVTLSEKTTISNPRYLFAFTNFETKVTSYCLVGTDTTTSLERGNRFTITEQASADPAQSEVELSVGQYSYMAYQLTSSQATALDYDNVDLNLYQSVEGPCQMRVKITSTPNTFYTSAPVTDTVYES